MAQAASRKRKQQGTTLKTGKTDWDLSPLFAGDDDPRMELKRKIVARKGREFITTWKDRTDYLEDPAVLRLALDQYEAWKRLYGPDGDEGYYFWLRTQQDQTDPKLKARFNKIEEFSKKKMADLQAKNKQAQDLQNKLQQGGTVLSETAREQTQKELQKLQREAWTDEDGELWVEGPNVASGYIGRPEETAQRFFDRRLRTGDVFEKDGDLFVHRGRIDGRRVPDFGVTAVWGYGARGARPDRWTRHDLVLQLLAERLEDLGYPSPAGGRGWRAVVGSRAR